MRAAVSLVLLLAVSGPAPAWADDPAAAPSLEAVEAQRSHAVERTRALKASARRLKKLSRELGRAGEAPAYAKWLESAEQRVSALGGRWQSSLTYFQRDYPNEALAADPERLAAALAWIGGVNRELGAEAVALEASLAERNASFAGSAPADALDEARAALGELRPGQRASP